MKPYAYLLAVALACTIASCTYSPPTQYTTVVADEHLRPIRYALVIPVADTNVALRVGPDGSGPEGAPAKFIGRPFLWSSGEDLIPSDLQSSATMFLPMVVAGRDVSVLKWLILKRGYEPLIVSNNENSVRRIGGYYLKDEATSDWRIMDPDMIASRKKDIIAEGPIFTLKAGGDTRRRQVIGQLTETPPDMQELSIVLGLPIDRVSLTGNDRRMIRQQL